MIKLYAVVGSGNCRKVQATLSHLDMPVEIEYMDFLAGDLEKPAFLALNPNGRVPTMCDGDFILWESNAIMQYVADKKPGNSLFPSDAQLRADIHRWQCWELAHFNNAFGTLAYETVLKPAFMQQTPNEPVVAHAQQSLAQFCAILEQHLANRQYMVGNDVTLADYSMVNIEGFKDGVNFDWTAYPNINAYFDRMRADPHWAASAPQDPSLVGRIPDKA